MKGSAIITEHGYSLTGGPLVGYNAKKKFGTECIIEVKVPRDHRAVAQFKWAWSYLHVVHDNMPEEFDPETGEIVEVSEEALMRRAKVQCGFVEIFQIDGHEVHVPESIAYENMPPERFELFQQALTRWGARLCNDMQESDLSRAIDEFMGFRA